jgi:peroxiredoxin
MKNLLITKAAIGLLAISLCGCGKLSTSGDEHDSTNTTKAPFSMGDVAPDFTLPDLSGNTISSKSLKGKFVVIHFATTWCPFCNAEAPNLEKFYQEYKKKHVQVLVIDVLEAKNLVVQKLRDKFNLTFPILLDEDGAVATRFAPPDALPDLSRDEVMLASNLIIDPDGNIQYISLLDTHNFDAKLVALRTKLNELLNDAKYLQTGSTDFIQFKGGKSTNFVTGGLCAITVSFQIKDGYHIQANEVDDDSLIPVKLEMETCEGISYGIPIFPEWKEFKMEGTNDRLRVFDEMLDVKIPLTVSKEKSPRDYLIKGNLHYQACDSWKCYFPRVLEFEVSFSIG